MKTTITTLLAPTSRAERLVEFHEMTTPVLKLALVAFAVSLIAFVLAAPHSELSEDAFFVQMASIGALAIFGIPSLMGRGYKLMAADQENAMRAVALRARARKLHGHN